VFQDFLHPNKTIKGRGAAFNPPNRFDQVHLEPLEIEVEDEEQRPLPTVFYKDTSKTILAKNDSPDIGFTYSINPYRGCEHGCIYCYARPSHEYLGFSSGIDFETKIMVKLDAPKLLEETFKKKNWKPQMVCFSGNTDCYQPVERKLCITRQCLEVFLQYRNPVGLITKNFLVTRDIDILKELSSLNLVTVIVSITSLNNELIHTMEPRTSTPAKRLEAVKLLANNGIPTGVNVAPVIPGLNDEEIPSILKAASEHGAKYAGYTIVRLSHSIKDLFLDWLRREMPQRAPKIINRIREVRNGELNDTTWNVRMRGEGAYAKMIQELFKLNCEKYGLNKEEVTITTEHFRREHKRQLELFG
jgi:DNA repair photolyase